MKFLIQGLDQEAERVVTVSLRHNVFGGVSLYTDEREVARIDTDFKMKVFAIDDYQRTVRCEHQL